MLERDYIKQVILSDLKANPDGIRVKILNEEPKAKRCTVVFTIEKYKNVAHIYDAKGKLVKREEHRLFTYLRDKVWRFIEQNTTHEFRRHMAGYDRGGRGPTGPNSKNIEYNRDHEDE